MNSDKYNLKWWTYSKKQSKEITFQWSKEERYDVINLPSVLRHRCQFLVPLYSIRGGGNFHLTDVVNEPEEDLFSKQEGEDKHLYQLVNECNHT